MLFELGSIVGTPDALRHVAESGASAESLIARHSRLDIGDLCEDDHELNRQAIEHGSRIVSCFKLADTGTRVYVITEADRSATTLMLTTEY